MQYFNYLYNENDLIIIKEVYRPIYPPSTNYYQYDNENRLIFHTNLYTSYLIEYYDNETNIKVILFKNIPHIPNIIYSKNNIDMIVAYKNHIVGDYSLFGDSKEEFESAWKLVEKTFGYLFDEGYTIF